MANSIHDQIGAFVVTKLTEFCQTAVTDEVYRATLIRQGTLQQDPVRPAISLLVNPGDPDDVSADPKWLDRVAGSEGGWNLPSYEIGGGEFWWRRFTIDVNVYRVKTKEDRTESRNIGMWVQNRVQKCLADNKAVSLTDDTGESTILLVVDRVTIAESGGPPASFIWRGKVFFSVLTEKPATP